LQTGHISTSDFSHDGRVLAVAGSDNLQVIDLSAGELRGRIGQRAVYALTVSADGGMVAAAQRSLTGEEIVQVIPMTHILVVDAATGSLVCRIAYGTELTVTAMAFSANGRLLAAGDDQGHVQVWSLTSATANLSGQRLQLTEAELGFLARLSPLIRTPRAAKRLVNVYRLLRAPLGEATLARLLGDGGDAPEYPAVLLLLTIVTGFPDPAQVIIGGLLQPPGGTWPEFLGKLRADRTGAADDPGTLRWKAFFAAYDQLDLTGLPEPIEVYARWAPQAARYSFRTGRLLG
jgi:hypothetical protein